MGPRRRWFRIVIWLIVASLLLSTVGFAIGLLIG
jgi:hypothetical protein